MSMSSVVSRAVRSSFLLRVLSSLQNPELPSILDTRPSNILPSSVLPLLQTFRCISQSRSTSARGDSDSGSTDLLGDSGRRQSDRDAPGDLSYDDVKSEPMVYLFTGKEPDDTACCLSDATKEIMYSLHKEEPDRWTVEKLAKEYKIRRQRARAILWLKEIEKKTESEKGAPLEDDIEKAFEEIHGSFTRGAGERHWKMAKPSDPLMTEEEIEALWDEQSVKDEERKVAEFEERVKFHKRVMNGEILVKKETRRRPAEGWSYLVEELGAEGKRGRGGGRRYVAQADGVRRGLNDLEKDFLRREASRPRRRLVP
eukprot:TRINITY_DN19738_c0_g2_i1.p1 TRINITY_DN19738_c0_g2~~TRINITY_DN19738_c0_g2_i1.p1  ORF type:complete len:313 (+),score=48.56 TRINITY_DN19738_c0_g2_i1:137-1075(+)